MKILFIHNIIAPYRTPLFEALSKKYDIQVVYLEKKDKDRRWNQRSEEMIFSHVFLKNKNFSLFNKKITLNFGLKKTINEFNPDVLVTLDNPPNFITTINSILLAKKKGIPIILWTGAFDDYKTFQKNHFKNISILVVIKMIRKYIYSKVDLFWAYSKATKSHLINNYHIKENSIVDGLQGYPDQLIHFKAVDTNKRFKNNKLLFIGYLDERKGLDFLIKAFVSLLKQFPNYTLEIVGNGKLHKNFIKENEGIHQIRFLNYQDGVKKFDIINESKYLILPSNSDPWGWVVNEATSCKVPTLVSDAVMAKEILCDDQLIFMAGSVVDLTEKLKNLMLLPYDDYKSLSTKVYKNSRLHTLDKPIMTFETLIKN